MVLELGGENPAFITFKEIMIMGVRRKNKSNALIPVCFAYLHELVVLSNGDITTCCLDAKGRNRLGNIKDMSIDKLWQEHFLPWHKKNVEANLKHMQWESSLCRECLAKNSMSAFNAKRTDDPALIGAFHHLFHQIPVSLVIEPTCACNYFCRGCLAGLKGLGRDSTFLPIDTFESNILPIISKVKQVRLYNYGEPFMHPQIKEMIRLLRLEHPALSLHISTNGMLMNNDIAETLVKTQVNYLIISLHGGHTQDGLLKYSRRGPDINVLRSNIEYLVGLKRRRGSKLPWIFLKAILFDWNDTEDEMEDFLKFGKGIGADFTGWGDNASDPALSSKRVAPGTQAYQSLADRKLFEQFFYEFPAWPSDT